MSCFASTTIRLVISLVSDAIGSATVEFFSNNTLESAGSITSATFDFSSSGSCVWFRPARSPADSTAGTAASAGLAVTR